MTDDKLQILINKTIKSKTEYYHLLDKLENEYIRRFGHNPSETDDDNFIDVFHYNQGDSMTVKQMTDGAFRHEDYK
jgi:hypothetical protein